MNITREIFERECKRRFGTANPERMQLVHWERMVRTGEGPYGVRADLGLEPNYPSCSGDQCERPEPDWCFQRFGMSRTIMNDGRIICISGEHEDSYDPDFCIYNDVIVLRPGAGKEWIDAESGSVEIYGYPERVFPPTDFHSATLVGEEIYVIGRLGYGESRQIGFTPVMRLNTLTYAMEEVRTHGDMPGWVYEHHAAYDAARHAISVRGGMVEDGEKNRTLHLASHRLHLADMRWELIATHETRRQFVIQAAPLAREIGFGEPSAAAFRSSRVPHTCLLPEEHGVTQFGMDVQGVRIQFDAFYSSIEVTIEGALPEVLVAMLLEDVKMNIEKETGIPWMVREVEKFERFI